MLNNYFGIYEKVAVEGAFRGRTSNVKCVFIKLQGDVRGDRIEFAGTGNGSHVQCQVYLKQGMHFVMFYLIKMFIIEIIF